MSELIQDYLRKRGVRHFRGHHDDEYFFLVDVLVDGRHKRLNVHLQASGEVVQVSIAPDRYYPATARGLLADAAARWNAAEPGAEVVIHGSSDPSRVGVSVHDCTGPVDVAGLSAFVDHAIAGAIELFAGMRRAAEPMEQDGPRLRDAG